jgi:hypothetical protein
MSLARMVLENYRCFDEPQDVELRPLTIVLGRNNSGKSALVRAPLVLRTGVQTASPAPLDLDQLDEEMLESFTDLVYAGRSHGSIGLEVDLATGQGTVNLAATIQNIHEYKTQVASAVSIGDHDDRFRLEWIQEEPLVTGTSRYRLQVNDVTTCDAQISFRGLLPDMAAARDVLTGDAAVRLSGLTERIKSSFPSIRYVGPFRDRPRRRYRLPAHPPADVGTAGEHAAGILASDVVRQGGTLVEQVNTTLGELVPGWRVRVVERAGTYAVLLTAGADDTLQINLADTGTGVAQALPIFVQRARDVSDPPARPTLEIVEQPELHLHPAAHGPLAQLYAGAVASTRLRFLIETHSETFLLRIRRLIAEGTLGHDQVAVYFVEHDRGAARVRRILVDEDGNLDYWPTGVFAEDYDEARALAAAQLAREGAGAD